METPLACKVLYANNTYKFCNLASDIRCLSIMFLPVSFFIVIIQFMGMLHANIDANTHQQDEQDINHHSIGSQYQREIRTITPIPMIAFKK